MVEACAGSGKTWLLVSRMIRLLLAGAEPSELLAITFTHKAAQEMRIRLDEWLADLALMPDAAAVDFLVQRGLSEQQAEAALPDARGLLERVLAARPGPMITTFHGWFFHLLSRAPLPLRTPGELIEDAALLREEAWFAFAEELGDSRGSAPELAFSELAEALPLTSLRGLLNALLMRRAEWWAASQGYAEPVQAACAALAERLGVGEEDAPLDALLGEATFVGALREYHALVAQNGERGLKGDMERAVLLAVVLERLPLPYGASGSAGNPGAEGGAGDLIAALQSILLTQSGTPRACKFSKALTERLGAAGADRLVALHPLLAERLIAASALESDRRALRLNRLALVAGEAYLAAYQRLKEERGGLDFSDVELEAARLLDDDVSAGAVLMKLDARWKHLLLDEFQDTNPLQWRILRAWLAAYGADGARPTVFLVGDAKQSIYRFRRAEPRLFTEAAGWLTRDYGAQRFPQNETRRCAPRIVAWVNGVFAERPDYPDFQRHEAHQIQLPGWCELHLAAPGDAEPQAATPFRNLLTVPPPSSPHRRAPEAAWVARRIREIVGCLQIEAKEGARPARYGDITVLYAKRSHLAVFEEAFKTAGIPFLTDRRGGLLDTLEASDITALLSVLVNPADDLALAHALKSPLFGLTDDDLKPLAQGKGSWWAHLLERAVESSSPPAVSRAANLLTLWRKHAGILPVHDLLDRIYHEAEVLARYAQAAPARLAPTVLANLEGLLGLSLTLSGGRYPSLPRFLDELHRLREKAGQDAPDEPPAAGGDRVRMLTIHSAKGLEAPVIFLIKADESEGRDEHYGVVMDWPPDSDRPAHFSLYGPKAWRGPGREDLFEQERAQAERERLNLLYVAMTRARQALFVTGLGDPHTLLDENSSENKTTWLNLLCAALPASTDLPEMTWRDSAPLAPNDGARTGTEPTALTVRLPPIGTRIVADSAEANLGSRVHAWLEWQTSGVDETVIRTRLALNETETTQTAAIVHRILAAPALSAAFDPACHLHAHNELTYLDDAGQTFRIDRLVEFEEEVWVLDYKTGGLDDPDLVRRAAPHLDQIDGYRRAARALYPGKDVRAVLVFGDGLAHWLE